MTRKTRHGQVRSTRLSVPMDKKLQQFCIEYDVMPSEVIQAAVECLLTHINCHGKKQLLDKLSKGEFSF